MRRRRVLVVGAGVAGVATAFALAKRGFSVAVVEAADRPGEECRSGRGGNYTFWRVFFLLLPVFAADAALACSYSFCDIFLLRWFPTLLLHF